MSTKASSFSFNMLTIVSKALNVIAISSSLGHSAPALILCMTGRNVSFQEDRILASMDSRYQSAADLNIPGSNKSPAMAFMKAS